MAEYDIDLTKSEHVDEYRQKFETFKHKIAGFKESEGKLSVGDKIIFWGGMKKHIRYLSEILGFDSDGDAYMLWDCYWYPVKLEERLISKLDKMENQTTIESKQLPVPQFKEVKFDGKTQKECKQQLMEWLKDKTKYVITFSDHGQDMQKMWLHESGEILNTDFNGDIYIGAFVDVSSEEVFDYFKPVHIYNPKFNDTGYDRMMNLIIDGIEKPLENK